MEEKYSVGEFERRFLLRSVPAKASRPRHITDHYVDGTRLRLRLVTESNGTESWKLGHKRREEQHDPTAIRHTSLYLDADEFAVVSTLPGRRLTKTRWTMAVGDSSCAVDEFTGDLDGLIMLEADLRDRHKLHAFTPPPWAGPEVTRDETFTGGQLAGRQLSDLAKHIAELLDT